MGKGRRNRDKRAEDMSALRAYEEVQQLVKRAWPQAKWLTVATMILTLLGVAFQALLQGIMYFNLNSGLYEQRQNSAEDIAALTKILPTGTIALVLIAVGILVTAVLLLRKKPALSLVGCAVIAAGIAFFIPYVVNLSLLFTYDALAGINNGEGLSLSAQIWQHYSMLFPLLLLIPAEGFAFFAQRKAFVADVMKEAQDTTSTLLLDDEDAE